MGVSPKAAPSPEPAGHWASLCPAFRRRPPDQLADYAAALDELAAAAGVGDGLILLQKEYRVTDEQVQAAGRDQAARWFLGCYARHGGGVAGCGGDAVFHGCGIWELDAGWDAPGFRLNQA